MQRCFLPSSIRSMLVVALTSSLISVAAFAAGAESREGLEYRRVESADGTYHYALPAGEAPPHLVERGPVVWRYDGQQTFGSETPDWQARPVSGEPSQDAVGVRVDRLGRRFVVDHVQPGVLESKIDAYDEMVARRLGDSIPAETVDRTTREEKRRAMDSNRRREAENEEQGGVWVPASFDQEECGNETINAFDGDDRVKITGTLTDRQEAIVTIAQERVGFSFVNNQLVISDPYWSVICSGVMISDSTILTAAHCITSSDGTPYDPSLYRVCLGADVYDLSDHPSHDSECIDVAEIIAHEDFSGSNDMNSDLGLMILDDTSALQIDAFLLSQASDSYITDFDMHNLAYPSYGPDCSYNMDEFVTNTYRDQCIEDDNCVAGVDYTTRWGPALYKDTGRISSHPSKKLGTKLDGVGGHSGSPIYYCGNAGCNAGESAFVTAVFSGFFYNNPLGPSLSTTKYNGGPKVSFYRDWIIQHME